MLQPLVDHTKLLTSKIKLERRLIGGPLDIVQKHKNIKTRGKEYFIRRCLWL
jgi:hypothetical protein